MLIDGHLLVGTTLMTFDDLHAGLDQFDQAIALFPAQRTEPRKATHQERPPDLVPDDLRVHPVAAGPSGSCGRPRGRRTGPRRRAGASVHLGVRPLPRWPPAPVASRLRDGAGPRDRTARAGRRSTGSGSGSRPGAACSGLPRSSSGASTRAWPTSGTASTATRSCGRPRSSGRSCCSSSARAHVQAGRPADGLRPLDTAHRDPGPRHGRVHPARAAHPQGRPPGGTWRPPMGATRRWPRTGTGARSIVRACSMPGWRASGRRPDWPGSRWLMGNPKPRRTRSDRSTTGSPRASTRRTCSRRASSSLDSPARCSYLGAMPIADERVELRLSAKVGPAVGMAGQADARIPVPCLPSSGEPGPCPLRSRATGHDRRQGRRA